MAAMTKSKRMQKDEPVPAQKKNHLFVVVLSRKAYFSKHNINELFLFHPPFLKGDRGGFFSLNPRNPSPSLPLRKGESFYNLKFPNNCSQFTWLNKIKFEIKRSARPMTINERHHSRNMAVDFVIEQMKNNRRAESEKNEDDEEIKND